MAARGRYVPPALRQREEERQRRERERKGKPLDRMERLAMISRGGDEDGHDSLKDYRVQEEFRAYIEGHIAYYGASNPFPPAQNDDGSTALSSNQRETLTNILIMLRKLREGILAAQRVDDFAIEAYETSARLAIYCQDDKALSSVFGRLVPDLYDEHEEAKLVDNFALLRTNPYTGATQSNGVQVEQRKSNRDEYLAVYLLHLIITGYPSQRDVLPRMRQLLPRTSPNFDLVKATATHVRRGNFWALSQLVIRPPPSRSDLIQRMLVVILAKTRTRSWATLKAAYIQLQLDQRHWLETVLGFVQPTSVEAFMSERVKTGEAVEKQGSPLTWTINKASKVRG